MFWAGGFFERNRYQNHEFSFRVSFCNFPCLLEENDSKWHLNKRFNDWCLGKFPELNEAAFGYAMKTGTHCTSFIMG